MGGVFRLILPMRNFQSFYSKWIALNKTRKWIVQYLGDNCPLGHYNSFKVNNPYSPIFWLKLVLVDKPWKMCEVARTVRVKSIFLRLFIKSIFSIFFLMEAFPSHCRELSTLCLPLCLLVFVPICITRLDCLERVDVRRHPLSPHSLPSHWLMVGFFPFFHFIIRLSFFPGMINENDREQVGAPFLG